MSVLSKLSKSLFLDMGIQLAGFAAANAMKTEKFYDLTGSLTFLLLMRMSLRNSPGGLRRTVNSSMVMAWALRLGSFLFYRVLHDGGDSRFDKVKFIPKVFFQYWMIQGVWVFMTALPVLLNNSKSIPDEKRKEEVERVGLRDVAGWSLWAAGFVLQCMADYQKMVWKSKPENAGRYITSGVWGRSQHPNYAGEIAMWSGLWLSSSSNFRGAELLSVASPAFVAYLLTQVSGVPLLRKAGLRKWGGEADYRRYISEVPLLVPSLFSTFKP